MTAILIIEGIAIALLAVLIVGLLRSHADILRQLHEMGLTDPSVGADSPGRSGVSPRPRLSSDVPAAIQGQTLEGSAVHVALAGSAGRTLLAFLSTGCSACMGLWEELEARDPVAELPDTRMVIVAKGKEAESPARLRELAPSHVKLVLSTEAWDSFGVPVTPFFVLIEGSSGEIVGEGSSSSWGQVVSLMGQSLADRDVIGDSGSDRGEFKADAELRRAGIGPGHPSLYPEGPPTRD